MAASASHAQPTAAADPAALQVDAFNRALLAVGRAGAARERVAILTPAVSQSFNIGVMAGFVIGAPWAPMSATDRAAIAAALARYLVVRFASEFAGSANAVYSIDPVVQARGADKVVRTQFSEPRATPDRIDYRLRAYGGVWKVIDIYYNGVSELTTRRADLAATAASGGAAALVARIEHSTGQLSP